MIIESLEHATLKHQRWQGVDRSTQGIDEGISIDDAALRERASAATDDDGVRQLLEEQLRELIVAEQAWFSRALGGRGSDRA